MDDIKARRAAFNSFGSDSAARMRASHQMALRPTGVIG